MRHLRGLRHFNKGKRVRALLEELDNLYAESASLRWVEVEPYWDGRYYNRYRVRGIYKTWAEYPALKELEIYLDTYINRWYPVYRFGRAIPVLTSKEYDLIPDYLRHYFFRSGDYDSKTRYQIDRSYFFEDCREKHMVSHINMSGTIWNKIVSLRRRLYDAGLAQSIVPNGKKSWWEKYYHKYNRIKAKKEFREILVQSDFSV